MPRNHRFESLIGGMGGKCKIRKRNSSSSSSSPAASSMLHSYSFKKAVLVNKRGGSTTPVPKWRMCSNSPASMLRPPESPEGGGGGGGRKGKQVPVSVRKLAATLWEMNELNSPRVKVKRVKKDSRRSLQSASLPHHLSDPSHSPVSERLERSGIGSYYGRTSNTAQKIIRHTGRKFGGFDSVSNLSFMEIERQSHKPTPAGSTLSVKKTHLKDLSNGLTTSKDLVTILSRMWGIEEHYSSGKSIISALCVELDRAHQQADHLIQEQRPNHKEINSLVKHCAEEKAAWKKKVQERVEAAVKSISNDLEMERKLRRRTESLTKALGRELAETKAALAKVVKELESEKRAREIMEQVGDELARDIGEDRAMVEQLKKESVKVREEVEKEREMLHVADVLREERVHMKLLDAKYQFEEKNAAVDKLKSELEAFLRNKEAKQDHCDSQNHGGTGEVDYLISSLAAYQNQQIGNATGEIEYGGGCNYLEPEDDSAESDLHSIELDMDNNRNYRWNYGTGNSQEDQKRHSLERGIKGRKSTSDKMVRGRVSLERCTSEGIEWEFNNETCTNWGDGYGQGTHSKNGKHAQGENSEIERQRHQSIKELRDYIKSTTSRLAPNNGFSSPTKSWNEP